MKRAMYLIFLCLTLMVGTTAAHAALSDFSTIPASGAVSGPAGSSLRWDYAITNNDPTNWLVITSLSGDVLQYGTPSDIFDYPIIQPSSQVSGGLYEFTWNMSAPVGFTNSGQFTLSAELWDGDPFSSGVFVSLADDASMPYTATVAANPVPVPPSIFLLGAGLVGTGFARLVQRRRRQN